MERIRVQISRTHIKKPDVISELRRQKQGIPSASWLVRLAKSVHSSLAKDDASLNKMESNDVNL